MSLDEIDHDGRDRAYEDRADRRDDVLAAYVDVLYLDREHVEA